MQKYPFLHLASLVNAAALDPKLLQVLNESDGDLRAEFKKGDLKTWVKPLFDVYQQDSKSVDLNGMLRPDTGSNCRKAVVCSWVANADCQVERLLVCNNKLGPHYGRALGMSLKTNSSLRELDVSANGLGPDAGKAIAASIADNSTITSVSY